MRLPSGDFACEFCSAVFERRHRRGRQPHYCGRTCRQRAYEARRRGAYTAGLPASPLPRSGRTRTRRPAYETGLRYPVRHALRPDGAPDHRGGRPTLCGARAWASPMAFEPWLREIEGQRTCRTCRALAERFPPVIPPDPSNDLARARHLLGRLRAVVAGRCTDAQMRRAVGEVLAAVDTVLPNPPVPTVRWPGVTPITPIEPQRLLAAAGAPARPG